MKLKKLFLALSIFLVSLMPLPVLASGNDLQAVNMNIYINQDGSAKVEETWKMDAIEGQKTTRHLIIFMGLRSVIFLLSMKKEQNINMLIIGILMLVVKRRKINVGSLKRVMVMSYVMG